LSLTRHGEHIQGGPLAVLGKDSSAAAAAAFASGGFTSPDGKEVAPSITFSQFFR
jgi:hypothetical protein